MVLDHLPLVRAIAARIRRNAAVHLEFNDLVQAGIVGLLEASARYSPAFELPFSAFAGYRIRGAILDSLRQQDPAARKLRRAQRSLENARAELVRELNRAPSESEVAERAGIGIEESRKIAVEVRLVCRMLPEGEAELAGELEGTRFPSGQPEAAYGQAARTQIMTEILGRLPHLYRSIVILHYGKERTLKQIGCGFGMPERQASRLHRRALAKMGMMLAAKGITSSSEI